MLRDDMQRQLGEQQFSTVTLAAAQINSELDERQRALENIAATITPGILADSAASPLLHNSQLIIHNSYFSRFPRQQ